MSNTTLGTALLALIERDLKLAYRHRGALAYPLFFFVIVISLFPLAVGSTPEVLRNKCYNRDDGVDLANTVHT